MCNDVKNNTVVKQVKVFRGGMLCMHIATSAPMILQVMGEL